MSTVNLEPGARVRLTADNLGAMASVNDAGFVATVAAGAEGTVSTGHPNLPDWLIVAVALPDEHVRGDREDLDALELDEVLVPVHPSHVEPIG